MNDISKLHSRLLKMCSENPVYKAIFFGLASRIRSREETSVDATLISINKTLELASKYIKGEAISEEDQEKIKLNKTELRNLFKELKEAANKRATEKNDDNKDYVPKFAVDALFKDLQALGVGKYIPGTGRNKSRFRWEMGWCNNLGCAALGKCDLLMVEDYKFMSANLGKAFIEEVEEEIVKVRGARCIIRYEKGFEENEKKLMHFYKSIKNWIDLELEQYE